jgi:hypothetical protein
MATALGVYGEELNGDRLRICMEGEMLRDVMRPQGSNTLTYVHMSVVTRIGSISKRSIPLLISETYSYNLVN